MALYGAAARPNAVGNESGSSGVIGSYAQCEASKRLSVLLVLFCTAGADEIIPFADSEELVVNSGLRAAAR